MTRRQAGFTLVEIAIVLVIIGLLLGGILKGQELIVQARIKNVANDLNGVAAAVYSYQDRYRKIPGDDPTACSRWNQNTLNGDGDGTVETAAGNNTGCGGTAPTANTEESLFWQHLRMAGLIGGDTANADSPLNAVGGRTSVHNGALGLRGLVVCSWALPAKIANAVDSQFDDGRPNAGTVRARAADSVTLTGTTTAALASAFADTGSELYDLCKNL